MDAVDAHQRRLGQAATLVAVGADDEVGHRVGELAHVEGELAHLADGIALARTDGDGHVAAHG